MKRVLFFLALNVALPLIVDAQGKPANCELQPTVGCETYVATAIGEAGKAFAKGLIRTIQFSSELATLRSHISQQCSANAQVRDHPDAIPEMHNFIQLLNDKDAYFLYAQYDVLGWGPAMVEHNEDVAILTNGGKPLDGGPRPKTIWDDFIKAMNARARTQASSFAGILQNVADYNNAKSNGWYKRYLIARNQIELSSLGCNATSDPTQLWQDALLMDQPWAPYYRDPDVEALAREYFTGALDLFGDKALGGAAETILKLPRNRIGQYRFQDGWEADLMDSLLYGLETFDDRAYARKALLVWDRHFKPARFEEARQVESMLVAAYGSQALDTAGHLVRSAPRTPQGQIVGFGSGWRGIYPRPALFDALAKNDAQGYVRAILAFEKRLMTKDAVDSTFANLVSTYGAAAVKAASQNLSNLWASPAQSIPAPYKPVYLQHSNGSDPGVDAPLLYELLGVALH